MLVSADKVYDTLDINYNNGKLYIRQLIFGHYRTVIEVNMSQREAMRFIVELYEFLLTTKGTDEKIFETNDNLYIQLCVHHVNDKMFLGIKSASKVNELSTWDYIIYSSYCGETLSVGLREYIITQLS